nr:chromosomal replication initiator protein DnaA [Campylobacter portucalensis]
MKEQVFTELKKSILPNEFDKYIKNLILNEKNSKPGFIVFTTKNKLIAKFIQTKYGKKIEEIYELKTGIKPTVYITTSLNLNSKIKNEIKQIKQENKSSSLIETYKFENFIVGDCNRPAFLSSKCVAKNPGKVYNPFFLYGPSGLGKTHLLQSIGNYCIENGKIVICITSEQFKNDFTFHIKNLSMDKFRTKYRDCDILLVDDIQFLGNTDKIQEEFFNTFNHLKQKGGQIVMVSDKKPEFLKGFEERLLSRFSGGLIMNIEPPELETKMEIIRKKSSDNKIVLDDKIIEYIATNMGDNIREIESALNKINAYSTLMRMKITLELTKTILIDQIKERKENITIDDILKEVSKELNIKPSDIKSKNRSKNIVEARRICIYLSKILTTTTMPAIAVFFGLKDHSAVSHNIKKIKQLFDKDDYLKIKIEELKSKITKGKNSENM